MYTPEDIAERVGRQEKILTVSVFLLMVGTGFVIGDQLQNKKYERPELYSSNFNVTLNADNREESVVFDNSSASIYYENWNEFKAYIETENSERQINTTSDGQKRTVSEFVIAGNDAYRFYFRYSDNSEEVDGDFIRLYRIQQIQ
ncbi:MAG: hypothetical protein BRC29_03920 [Nanohaloarchaea archaeon SW_7_43_1]|nr:MAG: hypothetical protein BRC29_03920 [Nanohaloarchaea archaeon SW_7_43_1]